MNLKMTRLAVLIPLLFGLVQATFWVMNHYDGEQCTGTITQQVIFSTVNSCTPGLPRGSQLLTCNSTAIYIEIYDTEDCEGAPTEVVYFRPIGCDQYENSVSACEEIPPPPLPNSVTASTCDTTYPQLSFLKGCHAGWDRDWYFADCNTENGTIGIGCEEQCRGCGTLFDPPFIQLNECDNSNNFIVTCG